MQMVGWLPSGSTGATFLTRLLISWTAFLSRAQPKNKGLELSTSPLLNSALTLNLIQKHKKGKQKKNQASKQKEDSCGTPRKASKQSLFT